MQTLQPIRPTNSMVCSGDLFDRYDGARFWSDSGGSDDLCATAQLPQRCPFSAIKLGLLPNVQVADLALDYVKAHAEIPVVLDPVLVCKETHDVAVSELCQELIRFFPHVSVITPNLPEAELLAGQEIKPWKIWGCSAEITWLRSASSHYQGGNRLSQDKAVDVFYDGQNFTVLENPVIQGQDAGAGCTFASSIASHLLKGDELLPAVESSKGFRLPCHCTSRPVWSKTIWSKPKQLKLPLYPY